MLSKVSAAWILFGLMTSLAAAQQYDQSRDDTSNSRSDSRKYRATSELAKSNLNRVAASAGQIREVLVKDIGFMVELKRWIARDAADNGQVVEDSSHWSIAFDLQIILLTVFRGIVNKNAY